jgi:hypothetical protein
MEYIKFIIIIILFILICIFYLRQNKKEHLDISYEDAKTPIDCESQKTSDSNFFKKIYSVNDNELVFY